MRVSVTLHQDHVKPNLAKCATYFYNYASVEIRNLKPWFADAITGVLQLKGILLRHS